MSLDRSSSDSSCHDSVLVEHTSPSLLSSIKHKKSSGRKVIYKINFIVLPFLAVIMFLQQIDKQLLNYTGPLGFSGNTEMTLDQFYWLSPALNMGTMIMLIPAGLFVQKFPPAQVMGISMIGWGIVLTCMMACTNFSGLLACRLLLGICEATVLPAAFILIKTLYRRSQQLLYIGFCYTAMTAAVSFGSLITLGFSHVGDAHGVSAWKWVSLIWGTITIAASITTAFYLPDNLYSKRFGFTPEQQDKIDARVMDTAFTRQTKIQWNHIQEALLEPRYYCQVLIAFLVSMPMGCIGEFSSQIIDDFGFDHVQSILLNIPRGVYDILTYVFFARRVLRSRLRDHIAFTIAGFSLIPLIGMILLCSMESPAGKMVGVVFAPPNFATSGTQAIISSNVSGYTKIIFYTISNVFAINLGQFLGPLLLHYSSDSISVARRTAPMIVFIVAEFVSICLLLYIGWSLYRDRNIKLNHLQQVSTNGSDPTTEQEKSNRSKNDPFSMRNEGENLTDVQDIHFIYRP
ncbi:major facilitator superfamily domain-containing protein [Phascolomyces articulosus]|uniref:Major facilitator superfamily domain-containing protein n=1 Tax=Phascolomyces articulosus TaxID=60185 RepID=A0AAD5P948_9FUNG|nr:major facilitator superfamily domain-containing protein [Phascolomyces articulosus]